MRRWLVPMLVVAALGCATAALMWVGVFPSPTGFPRKAHTAVDSFPVATPVDAPPFTRTDARKLTSDLRSGSAARVSQAVVLPSGAETPTGFVADMAALQKMTFVVPTFEEKSDGTGTVRVEIVDEQGRSRTWTAYVAWADGRWKLTATLPMDTPSASAPADGAPATSSADAPSGDASAPSSSPAPSAS